jgi:hypothetical protein
MINVSGIYNVQLNNTLVNLLTSSSIAVLPTPSTVPASLYGESYVISATNGGGVVSNTLAPESFRYTGSTLTSSSIPVLNGAYIANNLIVANSSGAYFETVELNNPNTFNLAQATVQFQPYAFTIGGTNPSNMTLQGNGLTVSNSYLVSQAGVTSTVTLSSIGTTTVGNPNFTAY